MNPQQQFKSSPIPQENSKLGNPEQLIKDSFKTVDRSEEARDRASFVSVFTVVGYTVYNSYAPSQMRCSAKVFFH